LTTLGFFVVPMLFVYLPSPALAGSMAGQLFQVQTGISAVCALLLLALGQRDRQPIQWPHLHTAVALGLVGALASEFWVSPHIIARDNLALWHRLGSGLYLLQWLCALAVFHGQTKRFGRSVASA